MSKSIWAGNNQPGPQKVIGHVKQNGKVIGYKLSDESYVTTERAIIMAKHGRLELPDIAEK